MCRAVKIGVAELNGMSTKLDFGEQVVVVARGRLVLLQDEELRLKVAAYRCSLVMLIGDKDVGVRNECY